MNADLNPQDELRDQIQIQPEEACVGWPGDGSGTDDLADMNQNEADDYRNEGESINEDYEGYYEDRYESQYDGD
jgi:hypothetical protein